jgi:phospholipase A1
MGIHFNMTISLLSWFSLILLLLASPQALSHETDEEASAENPDSLVLERIRREREVKDNRSVLLPHRRNYVLPLTWAKEPNNIPFTGIGGGSDEILDQMEAQFQLSLKVPLAEGLFSSADALYAGFTVRAFWQAYNKDISSPFRETNYEPELFWITAVPWKILGGDASLFVLGLSHQSNGRSQPNSRSWNRIYANLIWERNRFVFSFKPWWRIPEDEKTDPMQADGDDNPDIEDFMGNFEFTAAYRKKDQEFSMMLRNNLDRDDNKGAVQLDWTFPLNGRLRGYVQVFSGYGESLIDYNARIERIGFGILLSDLL